MGLFDKIKNVAQVAVDKVSSLQEDREKDAVAQSLERYGFIQGDGIPEKAEYCLDDNNDRIVIFEKLENGKRRYITEYNYDSVADFKLVETSQSKYDWWTTIWCDVKLTTLSGEELLLSQSFTVYDEKDESKARLELNDKLKIRFLILTFALVMNDAETKKWANSFYEQDDLLPVFDKNGEILISNIEANIERIKRR